MTFLLLNKCYLQVIILCYFQVGVRNLKMVGSEGWTLMREGEVEKQVTVCHLDHVSDLIVIFFYSL